MAADRPHRSSAKGAPERPAGVSPVDVSPVDVSPVAVSPGAQCLITALLSLEPDVARAVRARAVRSRPRRQLGPSAEYGEPRG